MAFRITTNAPRIAIIDLGTNTALLLIAEWHEKSGWFVLEDASSIVRLGEGLHTHQRFAPQALERCFLTFSDFQKKCLQYNIPDSSVFVVGTAACRMSQNTKELQKEIQDRFSWTLQVISGETEADLIFSAMTHDFKNANQPLCVLDIGGGSTELICDTDNKLWRVSLPFGVVTLTERFINQDPPTEQSLLMLETFVSEALSNQVLPYLDRTLLKEARFVATAGTPTTMSAVWQKLLTYDPQKVHGSLLSYETVSELTSQFCSVGLEERKRIPCLPEKRADLIIAGGIILKTVMSVLGLKQMIVSDKGLRHGILKAVSYEPLT